MVPEALLTSCLTLSVTVWGTAADSNTNTDGHVAVGNEGGNGGGGGDWEVWFRQAGECGGYENEDEEEEEDV